MKINLFGMYLEEVIAEITKIGLQKFRGQQIVHWMYQHGVSDFENMSNLSFNHRQLLKEHFAINTPSLINSLISEDKKTIKYLLGCDNDAVESVLMKQPYGNSVCVSTQVGCAMGCRFCASTMSGLIRNLTAGEILGQVLFIQNLLATKGQKVDSIVIMGSGEPLANYDNVLRFIRLCHKEYCLNLSYRSITLSTSGLVPQIYKLAQEKIPINLSISLHAPNNILRSNIMPINKLYKIEDVVKAADYYTSTTKRRVTYEYTLIAGLNDSVKCAEELSSLLKGRLMNVNVIPINPVPERGMSRPDIETINSFLNVLKRNKINSTLRREMGTDIQAACGQLRLRHIKSTTDYTKQ